MKTRALSLGDLIGHMPDKRPKNTQDIKCVCVFCEECWEPRSGQAARIRDYCYKPKCEMQNENRINIRKNNRRNERKLASAAGG